MSEIIYLKDVLIAKAKKKNKKTTSSRPKLKPFKYDKIKEASLINREKKDSNR